MSGGSDGASLLLARTFLTSLALKIGNRYRQRFPRDVRSTPWIQLVMLSEIVRQFSFRTATWGNDEAQVIRRTAPRAGKILQGGRPIAVGRVCAAISTRISSLGRSDVGRGSLGSIPPAGFRVDDNNDEFLLTTCRDLFGSILVQLQSDTNTVLTQNDPFVVKDIAVAF